MSDYNLLWNETEVMTEAPSTTEFTDTAASQQPVRIGESTSDYAAAGATNHGHASAVPSALAADRRKRKRAQVKMSAAVRSSQSIRDSFREVVTTENASRAGLCFRTRSGHYQAGMKLRVTFPYSPHSDGDSNSENQAEIVRLERLPGGAFRVAVTLDPPRYTASSNHSVNYSGKAVTARPAKEHRQHKRTEFSAVAVLREEQSETVMNARCSEVGVGGCYIDTLNPFPIGTCVSLEIQKDERVFTTYATVCSSHLGSGMGLSFHNLTPEKTALLFNWLS